MLFSGPDNSPKLPLPSNTWFLGFTQVSPRNGISIGLATFAGHIRVTTTQIETTLRATSVPIGRIYAIQQVAMLAILPKNC